MMEYINKFKAEAIDSNVNITDCAGKHCTMDYGAAADIYDELLKSNLWTTTDTIILIYNNHSITLNQKYHEYARDQIYCALLAIYWDNRFADEGEILDHRAKNAI